MKSIPGRNEISDWERDDCLVAKANVQVLVGCDCTNPASGQPAEVRLEGDALGGADFDEQTAIGLAEERGEWIIGIQCEGEPQSPADAHFGGGDGEAALAQIVAGVDQSRTYRAVQSAI